MPPEKAPRQKRRKRTAEEAREEALVAARDLLLSRGPAGVTVSNVGTEIGMSHTNVIHHFGSASELHSALMGSMINDLTGAIDKMVEHLRTDQAAVTQVVDQVFDAFGEGGAGQLAAWLALAREFDHLEPVRQAITDLVAAVRERMGIDIQDEDKVASIVFLIAICAFGDAVIGDHLRDMLKLEPPAGRQLMYLILPMLIPYYTAMIAQRDSSNT